MIDAPNLFEATQISDLDNMCQRQGHWVWVPIRRLSPNILLLFLLIRFRINFEFFFRLHKRTESKKGKVGVKSTSPCLSNSVVKDTEVTDIGHRKEDSDRVPVHKENLYSRLQKHRLPNASEMNHFCVEQPRQRAVAEESNDDVCPLRLTEVENIGDSVEDERGIPDLTAEVDPVTVDNVNSSSYKKGHYSTNACDSIRLSSTSQAHVHQRLHTAESIPDMNCRSRDYHHPSFVRYKGDENDPCGAAERTSCVSKRPKSHGNRLVSTDEQDDRKTPNEESYEFEDDDSPPSPAEEKKMLRADFRENDDALHETSSRSDDECCDLNSAKVIMVQKYDMEKEVDSEGCESPITVDASAASHSDSVEFCGLNSEGVVEEINTESVLKCYSSTVSSRGEEDVMAKSDVAYVAGVESAVRSGMATLCATEMDSRVNIAEGSGATVFSSVPITNYNSDLTGHMNLEDGREPALKRSTSRRKDHAFDASSKSSRKLQKRLSSAKSKFGMLMENVQDESKSHKGKSKNKSTKSQRRDRQRSATAEIGEADDDSGIQGDIYEFSEKESNLEDIGILSIIRRGKHESHASSSSIAVSPIQEMQCNDEYNKAEPPVLVPEEPWPPTISQSEHGAESNSVQSRGNYDVAGGLER